MPRTSDKRERLVAAAKDLIHRQGYTQTTLADIASVSGVPLGNVYYYFKTKDELAAAVIAERADEFRAATREWDRIADPRGRLRAFLGMVSGRREILAEYGCPIGSLCLELNKDHLALADRADALLSAQLEWVTEQFQRMGREDAADLGMQMVVTLQGISVLANALKRPEVVDRQVTRLDAWLQGL